MRKDHRPARSQQGTTLILIEENDTQGYEGQNIPGSRVSFFLREGVFTEAIQQRVRRETGHGTIPKGVPSELCLFMPRSGHPSLTRQAMHILEEELPGVTFVTRSSVVKSMLRDAVTQIKYGEWKK